MRMLHILKSVVVVVAVGVGSMATAFFLVFLISLILINPNRSELPLLANYPALPAQQVKENADFIGQQFGPYARKRYVKCHVDASVREEHPEECALLEQLVGHHRLTQRVRRRSS